MKNKANIVKDTGKTDSFDHLYTRWCGFNGVAPQAPIRGLSDAQRAYIEDQIQNGAKIPQGFVSSHSIGNYKWIFNLNTEQRGYVKPRK